MGYFLEACPCPFPHPDEEDCNPSSLLHCWQAVTFHLPKNPPVRTHFTPLPSAALTGPSVKGRVCLSSAGFEEYQGRERERHIPLSRPGPVCLNFFALLHHHVCRLMLNHYLQLFFALSNLPQTVQPALLRRRSGDSQGEPAKVPHPHQHQTGL